MVGVELCDDKLKATAASLHLVVEVMALHPWDAHVPEVFKVGARSGGAGEPPVDA